MTDDSLSGITFASNACMSTTNPDAPKEQGKVHFIVDNSASHHLVNDKGLFDDGNLQKVKPIEIASMNGDIEEITEAETVTLITETSEIIN